MKSVKTVIIIILFGLGGWLIGYASNVHDGVQPPPQAYYSHYVLDKPYIDGPEQFKKDIGAAMEFLRLNAPQEYANLCKYCVSIKLTNKDLGRATIDYNGRILFTEPHYRGLIQATQSKHITTYPLPTTLVHETAHLKQPRGMEIVAAEREALAAERQFLETMKVPPTVITQVAGEQLLETEWWKD